MKLMSKYLDVEKIKEDFPIFQRKIGNNQLIYLDSASTSHKPISVLDSISNFYKLHNSNVHRGIYTLSEEATTLYEESRLKVANFIGANDNEIIFTHGTTESINMVAKSLFSSYLKKGDEIITTNLEHHSNFVPWQYLSKKYGLKLIIWEISKEGNLDLGKLENLITDKTKLIAVTHISNVLGTINPIDKIAKIAHKNNSLILIDGAQSVPHTQINVKELNIDILAFSGHKMLATTGIGVLYVKKDILDKIDPSSFGGGMISQVTQEDSMWAPIPWKFEAGTPNIEGAISISAAIDYLNKVGLNNIHNHEMQLSKYASDLLVKIPGLQLYGPNIKSGIISFNLGKIHPHDISTVLDTQGIAVRGGHHCCMPLMKSLCINGTTRASFYLYNTFEDIEYLSKFLLKVKEVFK